MRCNNCGEFLPDDAKFCARCGMPLTSAENGQFSSAGQRMSSGSYDHGQQENKSAVNNAGQTAEQEKADQKAAVESYLSEVEKRRTARAEEYRRRVLEAAGIASGREYLTDKNRAYVNTSLYKEYDYERHMFFRRTASVVSEEDWQRIKEAYEQEQKEIDEFVSKAPEDVVSIASDPKNLKVNPVASALKVIAIIIYAAGALLGFWLGYKTGEVTGYFYSGYSEFSYQPAMVVWILTVFFGTLVLAASEVVRLLQEISDKC